MDCSPPGSSVHGVLQARILEWVAVALSRASCQPKDQTQISHIAGGFFTIWATREPPLPSYCSNFFLSWSAVLQLSPVPLCSFSLKPTLIIICISIMSSKLLHPKSLMVSMMPNLSSSLKPQLPWPLSTIWHRWWLSRPWDSSLPDLQGHVTFTCCCCC